MDKTRNDIIKKITKVNFKPLPATIPRPWRKLVAGMLREVPEKRWDMVRIQQFLERFIDNPEAPVSSDSEEEEKKEQPKKQTVIIKNSSFLAVPRKDMNKSLSPRGAKRGDFSSAGKGIASSGSLNNRNKK